MTATTPRASPNAIGHGDPRSITLGERASSLSVENLTVTGTGLFNLTGDDLNNSLTGNASVNTLTGNDGNDILDGGLGNDTLDGGTGNDTYILNGADIISFDTAGNDTVKSALTYSIAARADLDNITLLGAAAINATGNDGVNILTGNAAANILNGGGGADDDDRRSAATTPTSWTARSTSSPRHSPGRPAASTPCNPPRRTSPWANFNVENLTLTGTGATSTARATNWPT